MPVNLNLERIVRDLDAEHQETRGRAMQDLLMLARKDKSVWKVALAHFERALTTAPDSWTATSAARGVELINGAEAGRAASIALLNSEFDSVAESAALLMTDASYLPLLIEQLRTRTSVKFHCHVIRTLGRMRDMRGFQTILDGLNDVATRPDAIQALGDFGDARAVAYLEKYLDDETELWLEDDHGPMLRVRDLAREAIRQSRHTSAPQ